MVSCLMGDSTALASAIVRCCPRQDKKEQRRKCLESLSEEERAAELEKEKEQHKLMQKGSLMIIVACLLFGGIGFAVYFLVNALLN